MNALVVRMSDLDVFESSLNLEEDHQDAGFEAGLRRDCMDRVGRARLKS